MFSVRSRKIWKSLTASLVPVSPPLLPSNFGASRVVDGDFCLSSTVRSTGVSGETRGRDSTTIWLRFLRSFPDNHCHYLHGCRTPRTQTLKESLPLSPVPDQLRLESLGPDKTSMDPDGFWGLLYPFKVPKGLRTPRVPSGVPGVQTHWFFSGGDGSGKGHSSVEPCGSGSVREGRFRTLSPRDPTLLRTGLGSCRAGP